MLSYITRAQDCQQQLHTYEVSTEKAWQRVSDSLLVSHITSHHYRRRLHSTLRRLAVGLRGVAAVIKTHGDMSEGKNYGMFTGTASQLNSVTEQAKEQEIKLESYRRS